MRWQSMLLWDCVYAYVKVNWSHDYIPRPFFLFETAWEMHLLLNSCDLILTFVQKWPWRRRLIRADSFRLYKCIEYRFLKQKIHRRRKVTFRVSLRGMLMWIRVDIFRIVWSIPVHNVGFPVERLKCIFPWHTCIFCNINYDMYTWRKLQFDKTMCMLQWK